MSNATSNGTTRGYRRISLDTARSGSIDKQGDRIKAAEVVAGRNPREVVWYDDESVSGSKVPFADRVAGKRLLADLKAGDRVVVTKIDRAARNVIDLLTIVKTVKAAGASVAFVDDKIDTEGPIGEFILTVIAAIAELEAKMIAERRKDSLDSFKQVGRHAVGKAPFGFESVENPDGRGLVIRVHPEDGARLREAIDRVMGGESQETVRKSIDMSKTGFSKLLRNPRLAGMTPDGDGVVMVKGTPRIDPEAALLTMSEWNDLQAYLGRPEKAWSKREGYGAALACGVCGDRLYLNISGRKASYASYRCRKVKHEPGEGAPSIMVHAADWHLESTFIAEHGSRPYLIAQKADNAGPRLEAISAAQVRKAEVARRLDAAEADEEEDRLLEDYRAAKRALREAERMPVDSEVVVEDSGLTVGDLWLRSDDEERSRMLRAVGAWVLQPGRGEVEERIVLDPTRKDVPGLPEAADIADRLGFAGATWQERLPRSSD